MANPATLKQTVLDKAPSAKKRILVAVAPSALTEAANSESSTPTDYPNIYKYVKKLFRLHRNKGPYWAGQLVIKRFGVALKEQELEKIHGEVENSFRSKRPRREARQKSKIKRAVRTKQSVLLTSARFKGRLKKLAWEILFPVMVWFGVRRLTVETKKLKLTAKWTDVDGRKGFLDLSKRK